MEEEKVIIEQTVEPEIKQTKVFGILSLALSGASILGIIPVIGAIAGILFGSLAKKTTGEKLGQTGIIISIICFVLYAVELVIAAIGGIVSAVIVIGFMLMAFMAMMSESYY